MKADATQQKLRTSGRRKNKKNAPKRNEYGKHETF